MRIKKDIIFDDVYDPEGYYIIEVFNVDAFKASAFAIPRALSLLENSPRVLFYRRGSLTRCHHGYMQEDREYAKFIRLTF